ncbi:RidA family protein [Lachancea thermotolerans CBS 6340]|uniref:KLTH0C11880p n=1 Tax=Lachancea thermotolerans (strain ATCC 56472 / CBS 6340 / NRRL Y-8284) TaxID=559295 RepID=C5DES9_LACTC|nr:KLTH0C11880p [Lachancea thermotolerans CBS 6340]CAR22290.1 KLTH0C11880p [Lachancea thermotolerans CBS 6340]
MVRKLKWEEVGVSNGPSFLSPGCVSSKNCDLLFTSGCVGNDPITGEYPEDVESQARNAMENMKRVLESASSNFDYVLKALLFISDPSYASAVNKVYQEFFPGRPSRSCIVVSFPDPKLKFEMECVAEVPAN